MNSKEIILDILKKNNITLTALGKAVGKSINTMSITFNGDHSKSLRLGSMVEMLDAVGYKLVVMPKAQSVKNGYEVSE